MRDDDSIVSGSGMDVDEEGSEIFERGPRADMVFSKSREMTVTFYAQLPVEVRQALRNAGASQIFVAVYCVFSFWSRLLQGRIYGRRRPRNWLRCGCLLENMLRLEVHPSVSCSNLHVNDDLTSIAQALIGTPTCYIFSCPMEPFPPPMTTPFHALVPYGPQREPGLIVASNVGQVRFWDSIGMGLAGGDNYTLSTLDLKDGEGVTSLIRADVSDFNVPSPSNLIGKHVARIQAQTFVISSSAGRLFRLVVTSSGGKYHLSHHAFSRPSSSLSLTRLLPGFWSAQELQPQPGNINAVATCNLSRGATGRLVWALVDTRLQQWNMSIEGWEELLLEEDIGHQAREALWNQFPNAPREDVELDLEPLDLKMNR